MENKKSEKSWGRLLPSVNKIVDEKNFYMFFDTMLERMLIWKRRFIEDKPRREWTKNSILGKFKFTNVYRMLDRSSQWQIQNILLDETVTEKNLVWKLMVYRMFNNPETFENGLKLWKNGIPNYDEYDVDEFYAFIQYIKESGKNPFTNAYLTNSAAFPGLTRVECYTQKIMPLLHSKLPEIWKLIETSDTADKIVNYIAEIPCCGNFMAHEYYQDFTYIALHRDKSFFRFDQNDFTNVGPGASLGLRLIFPKLQGKEQKQGIYWLREIAEEELEKAKVRLGAESIPYVQYNKQKKAYEITDKCNITLHQIEMWLCEYQKYWKMIIGEGKQRSGFKPKTNVKYKWIQKELFQ